MLLRNRWAGIIKRATAEAAQARSSTTSGETIQECTVPAYRIMA